MLPTLLLAVSLSAPPAHPNVLVILTDDQGWGDLSHHGNTNLRTPQVDSLAKDGAAFDRFFVQPVCSPTRAEFLTGRYHTRCGVRGVTSGGERLNLDERTIADCFQAGGYRTAAFGKWHNGSQYPYHPNGRGFDEYYGFTSGHWGDYFNAPLDHNGKSVVGNGFITNDLTDKAIDYVTKTSDRPFFCFLAYNVPHSPMQVPDADWNRFKDREFPLKGLPRENINHTRAAYAMCENMDANVGRLLAALKGKNLDRDTIVVYFHDNGPNGPRWNGGMKGQKGSTDEGGVRSPLFVRWPGRIPAGLTVPAIGGAIDLLPTLTELAGIKRVGDKPLDGISLAKHLTDSPQPIVSRTLFQHWNGRVSGRSQTHRLDADGHAFDMVTDPNQTKPVGDQVQLLKAVTQWKSDQLANRGKPDDRPYPVGYSQFPRTVLPARDGVIIGGIKRSANAPNCSYFTNWTKTTDAMTWPIDVHEAGTYDAEVWVTVPKANVGAVIELTLNTATWQATFIDAHDPPLKGMEHDRVTRVGESYVKEFKAVSLGSVTLEKGRGDLRLRATRIPGGGVADVRQIVLTKRP